MGNGKIRIRTGYRVRRIRRRALLLLAVGLVSGLVAAIWFLRRPQPSTSAAAETAELAKLESLDLKSLRKQAAQLKGRVGKLEEKFGRLFPSGKAILVDSAENRICLVQGSKVIVEGKCSTGSGLELTDTEGKRTWTFDTPRGYFRVLGKVANPVWYRPDWAFIEEGEPIPKNRASRAVPYVLGDYAISFGDGYFIHGTLYTRLLGSSVTHGCIRVDDDVLERLYNAAQPGTPIWIY